MQSTNHTHRLMQGDENGAVWGGDTFITSFCCPILAVGVPFSPRSCRVVSVRVACAVLSLYTVVDEATLSRPLSPQRAARFCFGAERDCTARLGSPPHSCCGVQKPSVVRLPRLAPRPQTDSD